MCQLSSSFRLWCNWLGLSSFFIFACGSRFFFFPFLFFFQFLFFLCPSFHFLPFFFPTTLRICMKVFLKALPHCAITLSLSLINSSLENLYLFCLKTLTIVESFPLSPKIKMFYLSRNIHFLFLKKWCIICYIWSFKEQALHLYFWIPFRN